MPAGSIRPAAAALGGGDIITVRLILVAPAPGAALRETRIDDDAPLDERGLRQARAAASTFPAARRQLCAPSVRCRQTAEALGLASRIDTGLRDVDMGSWRGRTLADLAVTEPDALASWMTDPAAAPHGGESVLDLCDRVATWLGRLLAGSGRLLAVAEPAVIRAAVLHALSAPPQAFWRIDVPPLSATRLVGRGDRWNLRLGDLPD
jgi:broad specificity phosphatase PhoE